jgi:HK97 family phage portal protein
VTVISKAIAASTWDVFQEQADGNREGARNSRVFRLLNIAPNPEMTAYEFREALLVGALMWHAGYAEIERDQVGRPAALWPIHPDRVIADRFDERLIYRVWNQIGGETVLEAKDVFKIHGPSIDGLLGYEIARLAARSFGHSIAAETFGASFYGNGTNPGGALETEANLTKEQVQEFREVLAAQHQGPDKAHKFLMLGGGMKWKQMGVSPEQSQFVETRQHLIEEVARWFGVPPHKIGHLLRATFNNIEEQGLEFVRDALTPWSERLRQEADKKLIPRNSPNMRTRIELDWLSEGNAKAKAEADAILVTNGMQSRNEVRKRRGLNPVPDGDKLTVQLNMTTLEKIGEEAEPPAEPSEDDEDEEDTEGLERTLNRMNGHAEAR